MEAGPDGRLIVVLREQFRQEPGNVPRAERLAKYQPATDKFRLIDLVAEKSVGSYFEDESDIYFDDVRDLAVDHEGNIFVVDNCRVWRVASGTNELTLVWAMVASEWVLLDGTPVPFIGPIRREFLTYVSPVGEDATSTYLCAAGIAADEPGHVLVSSQARVFRVDTTSGKVTGVLGAENLDIGDAQTQPGKYSGLHLLHYGPDGRLNLYLTSRTGKGLLLAVDSGTTSLSPQSTTAEPGVAPDFELRLFGTANQEGGGTWRLSETEGPVLVLTWRLDGFSRDQAEIDMLDFEKLFRKHRTSGVEFIAVLSNFFPSYQDCDPRVALRCDGLSVAEAHSFVTKMGVTYAIGYDPSPVSLALRDYRWGGGAALLDKNHRIIQVGRVVDAEEWIEEMLR